MAFNLNWFDFLLQSVTIVSNSLRTLVQKSYWYSQFSFSFNLNWFDFLFHSVTIVSVVLSRNQSHHKLCYGKSFNHERHTLTILSTKKAVNCRSQWRLALRIVNTVKPRNVSPVITGNHSPKDLHRTFTFMFRDIFSLMSTTKQYKSEFPRFGKWDVVVFRWELLWLILVQSLVSWNIFIASRL